MRFDFKNSESGEIIEREFSMQEKIPESVTHQGKKFNRVWTLGSGGIHIPFQWGQETGIQKGFNKSPSQQKHFF